jgi:hypothetical protein
LFSGMSAYLKQRVWPSGRVQVGVVKRVWPSRRGQASVGKRGCGNVGVVMRALSNELGQVSDWGGGWVVSKWEGQWAGGHAETGGGDKSTSNSRFKAFGEHLECDDTETPHIRRRIARPRAKKLWGTPPNREL